MIDSHNKINELTKSKTSVFEQQLTKTGYYLSRPNKLNKITLSKAGHKRETVIISLCPFKDKWSIPQLTPQDRDG